MITQPNKCRITQERNPWPAVVMAALLGGGWLGMGARAVAQPQTLRIVRSDKLQSNRLQSAPISSEAAEPNAPSTSSNLGLLSEAQTAVREERYPAAEVLWWQLVQQWPESAEMSYGLGVVLHRQFKIEEAAQAYVTAAVLNPNHREAHINLSLARIQLGLLEEALVPLEQVLALADRPSSPASIHAMAYYNRAVILGRQGQLEASRAAVDAALAIAPDFREAKELIDLIR